MEQAPDKTPGSPKKAKALVIFFIVVALGVTGALLYKRHLGTHISTDDAYIEGTRLMLAPKVSGTVKAVLASDNQLVRKGDLLVELDPVDIEQKRAELEAMQDSASAKAQEIKGKVQVLEAQMSERTAALDAARARVELQETILRQAQSDLTRAKALFEHETISREKFEDAQDMHEIAIAQLKAAAEAMRQAQAAIDTQRALVRQAQAELPALQATERQRQAQLAAVGLEIGYTRLVAPMDGYVTRKSVEPGAQIKAGQPLMWLVSPSELWIIANFKETQLTKIRPGQPATIHVDMYPDLELKGTVDSIMSGTGSAFSLFPPENATGNFVKVVQRVPVKIKLDASAQATPLRVGMSVEPTIVVEQ